MQVGSKPSIRQMQLSDLSQAMQLANIEGWNQCETDWKILLENHSNICLVAEINGEIVGTATALNHSDELAWIGMVLVNKSFRGQGIGKSLMLSIIGDLKNFRSVKLDATQAGLPVYQKLGFVEERIIYRMTNSSFQNFKEKKSEIIPELILQKDFDEIVKFDKPIFGVNRKVLLESIYRNYPLKGFIDKKNNEITGYILGRDGIRYNYIGPLLAINLMHAKALLSVALKNLENKSVCLDVFEDKAELIEWLESVGFIKQRQFVRMFLKNNLYTGIIKNNYLLSGPEFG